ncbi:MAG TPA: phosphoribosylglycinamide formyltransferase [Gammaproteobacteria bacterium]|nr:phosphoribosylglycinamide formyltransferase [Gammaproteobacteria bacterium]
MTRLAVLASHEGTTLQAVIDACDSGRLDASVALVISNNSTAGALRRASNVGISALHISRKTHASESAADATIVAALHDAAIDWVLLLGYMRKLGPLTNAAFSRRIINTHPALLPKFGGKGFFGRRVHEAVLLAEESETGATIHLIDMEYDTGPILAQVKVPVLAEDTPETLELKVKAAEQQLLVETLQKLISKGVTL